MFRCDFYKIHFACDFWCTITHSYIFTYDCYVVRLLSHDFFFPFVSTCSGHFTCTVCMCLYTSDFVFIDDLFIFICYFFHGCCDFLSRILLFFPVITLFTNVTCFLGAPMQCKRCNMLKCTFTCFSLDEIYAIFP